MKSGQIWSRNGSEFVVGQVNIPDVAIEWLDSGRKGVIPFRRFSHSSLQLVEDVSDSGEAIEVKPKEIPCRRLPA